MAEHENIVDPSRDTMESDSIGLAAPFALASTWAHNRGREKVNIKLGLFYCAIWSANMFTAMAI